MTNATWWGPMLLLAFSIYQLASIRRELRKVRREPLLHVFGGVGQAAVHRIETHRNAGPGMAVRIFASARSASTDHDYTVYGSTIPEALDLLSALLAKDYPGPPPGAH